MTQCALVVTAEAVVGRGRGGALATVVEDRIQASADTVSSPQADSPSIGKLC